MKKNFCLIVAVMMATSLPADQPARPAPAAAQPEHTNAPPARPARNARRPARPAPELRTVPLVAGPAVVAVSPTSRVMVRGQGRLNSEIITRVTNGEPVVVIEEVQLTRSAPDEPSAWAKITLPEKAHPWVNTAFLDAEHKTVSASTLNLRGGPGENYSILGTLRRGDAVKEIETKNGWTEIESPAGAYAFIAAQYLKQVPAAEITSTEPVPTPTTTPVTETPTIATNTMETPVTTTTETNDTNTISMNQPAVALARPPADEPPPPRIVQREGIVRGTISIQAPTSFELISPDNLRPINYLYTTTTNLDLSRYKGLHIIVTGEEGLDERWKNTPVITIQRIQVLN